MQLSDYLKTEVGLSEKRAQEVSRAVAEYRKKYRKSGKERKKLNIKIPRYSLGEEIFNSVSHGLGAAFAIVALVLMNIKASYSALAETCVSLFGVTMIILYTMSCIYHALSWRLEGKKVLRVLDHCNVYLLVFGTYIPVALLGVGGWLGWALFAFVGVVTTVGIVLTSVKIDKFTVMEVICHLLNGWSILVGIPALLQTAGTGGVAWMLAGGIMYTVGSILYGIGSRKKYVHCIFHVFCLLGTICHFIAIYGYLLY